MKKIVKNTLINILLLSPLLVVTVYYWDNEQFRTIAKGLVGVIIVLGLAISVIFGLIRICLSSKETWDKISEMYTIWKRSRSAVNNDQRLEKCTKCRGLGYTYWINNINGKAS